MSGNLAFKIKQLIDEKNISVFGLEKKAGLKMNAVRHILSGQTKRPSAETILAISKVLGCTIGELLDEETQAPFNREQQKTVDFENVDLLMRILLCICQHYKENIEFRITNKKLMRDIEGIYNYCIETNDGNFDERFAKWYLARE